MLKSNILCDQPFNFRVDPRNETEYDILYRTGSTTKIVASVTILGVHEITITNHYNSPIYIEGLPIRINLQYGQTLTITAEWTGKVSITLWANAGTGSFEIQVTNV